MYLQWYDIKQSIMWLKKLKFVKMLYVPCVLVRALRGNQVGFPPDYPEDGHMD
jgi:hypothetical protein